MHIIVNASITKSKSKFQAMKPLYKILASRKFNA